MADMTLYVGDLYPPFPFVLSDSNAPINLASAAVSGITVKMDSGAKVITGAAVNLQVAFTGTFTVGTGTITAATATTGQLWPPGTAPWATGSTLYAPGYLPLPTGGVGAWVLPTVQTIAGSTGAYTLTLAGGVTALQSGTAIPIIANMGAGNYVWGGTDTTTAGTYPGVVTVTWSAGSKPETFAGYSVQILPQP